MEVYNSMKSISISEQIIPRKPLIAISSNKLKGKSLEKDESKNIYYESINSCRYDTFFLYIALLLEAI